MEPYVHDAAVDMHVAREHLLAAIDRLDAGDCERFVPYGRLTVKDVLAHLAAADQAWALAAQGLLKSETAEVRPPLTADEARAARERGIERGRSQSVAQLRAEMERRRKLLLSLYDLLEPVHLAAALPSFGPRHNSVRERIWRGYHDRLHLADIERAMRFHWRPQPLTSLPEIAPVAASLAPDDLLYVIYSVDPVYWERKAPSLDWTYRQLLAHVATGDWVLQTHLKSVVEDGRVAEWPDVAAGNAQRVRERRFSTDRALTEEYLSMRHETIRLLAALRREHLDLPILFRWETPPAEHPFIEYLAAFNSHDAMHRDQLRGAMKHAHATGGAPRA